MVLAGMSSPKRQLVSGLHIKEEEMETGESSQTHEERSCWCLSSLLPYPQPPLAPNAKLDREDTF